jgi:hypothetical protein
MNHTFTIDEDIIRRLVLRRDREEQDHKHRPRSGQLTPGFWRGLHEVASEPTWLASRAR